MGKNRATRFDDRTGRQVRENLRHARGAAGEQNIGFWLGDKGFVIIDGPSGVPLSGAASGGAHGVTAHGFDGIAFNPHTGEMVIYDNKSFARSGNVGKASALEANLAKNLRGSIERIEGRLRAGMNFPHSQKVLKQLKAAERALKSGRGWPKAVSLHIYNAGGKNIAGVSKEMAKKGIKFIDYYAAERLRRPLAFNPAMKNLNSRLRRSAQHWERKAGVKLADKAVDRLDRKIAKLAETKGVAFARKQMPKLIARAVMKQSAKQAAKRAASLVPLIGLAVSAEDVYKGVQDIVRGHTARGLAGIGIAAGDAAAELLHLGDAVSGVGGTLLSVGVQGAAIAGQIKIEMDRYADKMNELGEEIARLNRLPDQERLKSYYDLDQDQIEEMQRDFDNQAQESETREEEFFDPPPPMPMPAEFCQPPVGWALEPPLEDFARYAQDADEDAAPRPSPKPAPRPTPSKPSPQPAPPPSPRIPKEFPVA